MSMIATCFGPNLSPYEPEPVQESEYVPRREIVLGDNGAVEFRHNVARTDGTFHRSGCPGRNKPYVEQW